MTCTHCGDDGLTMSYTLRCTPSTREPRLVELQLCTDCIRQLCAEDDIELAEELAFVAMH